MAKRIPADVKAVKARVKGVSGRGKAPRAKKRGKKAKRVDPLERAEALARNYELRAVAAEKDREGCFQAVKEMVAQDAAMKKELSRLTGWLEEDRERLAKANGMIEAQAKRIEELKASAPVVYVAELEKERDNWRAAAESRSREYSAACRRIEELTRERDLVVSQRDDEIRRRTEAEVAERSAEDLEGRLEFEKRLVDDARSKLAKVEHERDRLQAAAEDHLRQIEGLQAALAPARAERDKLAIEVRDLREAVHIRQAKIADQAALLALDPFGEVERLTKALELDQAARVKELEADWAARVKELEADWAELVEARAFREALAKFLHPGGSLVIGGRRYDPIPVGDALQVGQREGDVAAQP